MFIVLLSAIKEHHVFIQMSLNAVMLSAEAPFVPPSCFIFK